MFSLSRNKPNLFNTIIYMIKIALFFSLKLEINSQHKKILIVNFNKILKLTSIKEEIR